MTFPVTLLLAYGSPGYRGPPSSDRARSAGICTMVSGGLILLISFFLTIFGFVFGGVTAGMVALLFGILPAVCLIGVGIKMTAPGADLRSLGSAACVLALLSLFSSGGLLIGALLGFVGGGLAISAANRPTMSPPPSTYAASTTFAPFTPAPPPPPPSVAWNVPTWAPPPPSAPSYPAYGTFAPPPPQRPTFVPLNAPAPVYIAPAVPQPVIAPPPPPPPPPLPVAPTAPTPRIAAPLTPVEALLAQDPNRSFDLEALNAIDFVKVFASVEEDRSSRPKIYEKATALIERLETDIADIDTVDDFLRDRTISWYRDSPELPNWSTRQTPRWAGLIAETRTAGGARTAALLTRLTDLQKETAPFQGPARKAFADFRKRGEEAPAPASSSLPAQIVQAVLDDLAATPRTPGSAAPLLRLSELANKATPAETNRTLASLFKAEPAGPFVILHPSRFPEFEFVFIRPPPPGAAGAAVAYEMVTAAADQPLPGAAAAAPSLPAQFAAPVAPADPTADLWARDAVGDQGWITALSEFERRRERIPTPPSDFRRLPPYFELRKLVIANPDARRTFLAVRWRGKPPGLPLLAQLLTERSLAPEVETDAEYLEAELSDLERGDPNWKPSNPEWTIASGVKVTRSGDHGGFEYAVA